MEGSNSSLDQLFEVLAHRRRRYVLYYLADAEDRVVTLDELADVLCAWEREWNGRTDRRRTDHRESVRIDLHHARLPQLANAGFVEYDARSRTVRSRVEDALPESAPRESDECSHLESLFEVEA